MEVITKQVYTMLDYYREKLYDEVVHNTYVNGKVVLGVLLSC